MNTPNRIEPTHDLDPAEVQQADIAEANEEIVSVNSRGSSGDDNGKKILFVIIALIVFVVGGLYSFNKYRAAKRESQKQEESQRTNTKTENKAATVLQRREFDENQVYTNQQAIQTNQQAIAATQDPAAQTTAAQQPACKPEEMMPVAGPDGKFVKGPNGMIVRGCKGKDGKVFVPAVVPQAGEQAGQVQPFAKQPGPGQAAGTQAVPVAGNGQQPPSRYAGDVLVPSTATTTTAPATQQAQQAQMVDKVGDMMAKFSQPGGNGRMTANPYSGIPSGGQKAEGNGASQNQPIGALIENPALTPAVSASMIGDRSMILPKGRSIDCALSTKVITEVSGMATCVLVSDVYSDNGRVVLLERGSEAVGEYTAGMAQGQRRLFLLWSRVKTPNGVVININSPSAGPLGESGVDGYVDNRWFDRIGAAFLLSMVQDAIAYKTSVDTAKATTGTATPQMGSNTIETGNKMVEKILESTINIKPVLYKNQGERVMIFVARDLDFGSVYALRNR